MDCVTCVLMGMCMLCTSDMGASEPGRPMTRAEVDQAVERAVQRFREAAEKEQRSRDQRSQVESRRDGPGSGQSAPFDMRYSYLGIGKREYPHAFTLGETPNRSAMTVYKSKQQTRPSAEKVLLLYPNIDSRKLPLSKILIPSRTEEAPPKTTISERDRRRVGRGSGNGAKKRKPEYIGVPGGIAKNRRFNVYKLSPASTKANSMSTSEFAHLLKRNILRHTKPTTLKIDLKAFEKRRKAWSVHAVSTKPAHPKLHAAEHS
ncbi:hypothetical protein EGW08_012733 [Elysia chlorotica]|uniref:Uncharacterized protein n=1 Tax=Elysia chlorotica TaxID=188477 RepID=A0A433TD05_ELYCH|nr:hypothetical protein EGW08_012733 [Elysia chlorotica]